MIGIFNRTGDGTVVGRRSMGIVNGNGHGVSWDDSQMCLVVMLVHNGCVRCHNDFESRTSRLLFDVVELNVGTKLQETYTGDSADGVIDC
jgi:hypothetical protein